MKVYIAGPITGIPDGNFAAFAEAAQKLRLEGHEVFNPRAANLENWPIEFIFAYEIDWLCKEAQAIALLPGWEKSGGASIEASIAEYLKKTIIKL